MAQTAKKNKPKPVTPENMRRMALSLIRYLNRNGMFHAINIYAGGTHYSDSEHPGQALDAQSVKGLAFYAGPYGRCPCEYSNPETLTMTFEGPLYHAVNYNTGRGHRAWPEMDAIFARYGLYLEFGHAWSLTCYQDPDIK